MEDLIKKSLFYQLLLLQILGFYPPQKYKKIYKIYSYAVYIFLTVLVPTLAVIHLVTLENLTLIHVSNNAFIISQVGCFICKMIPFLRHGDKVKENMYMLERPLFRAYKKNHEKIITDCLKICRRNIFYNLLLVLVAFVSWAFVPFVIEKDSRKLPLEIWLPYDPLLDTKVYFFTYFYILAGVGNGAFSNGVIDPLIAGLAYIATAQLKILKDNLQFLDLYAEEEIAQVIRRDEFEEKDLKAHIIYNNIKKSIKHHNAILDYIKDFEKIYSLPVFTQFVASVLVICNACLQLTMVEPFTFPFFAMMIFLLTMVTEIYLYSYYGTTLFEESNTLTDAIYMGKWYEYDIKSKSALIILMERSKKPIILTPGKILESSLNTFTTILRRAYSLLAVLKNF